MEKLLVVDPTGRLDISEVGRYLAPVMMDELEASMAAEQAMRQEAQQQAAAEQDKMLRVATARDARSGTCRPWDYRDAVALAGLSGLERGGGGGCSPLRVLCFVEAE